MRKILIMLIVLLCVSVAMAQTVRSYRHTELSEIDSLTAATVYLPDSTGWNMHSGGVIFDNCDVYIYADSLADTTDVAVWQMNLGTTASPQWVTETSTITTLYSESTDYKLSLSGVCYPAIRIKIYNAAAGEAVKARAIMYK